MLFIRQNVGIPESAPFKFWPYSQHIPCTRHFLERKVETERADRTSGGVIKARIPAPGSWLRYGAKGSQSQARGRKGSLPGASALCQVAQTGRTSGPYLRWGCVPTDLTGRSSSPPLRVPGVRRHCRLCSQCGNPLGYPAPLSPSAVTCSKPGAPQQSPARDA